MKNANKLLISNDLNQITQCYMRIKIPSERNSAKWELIYEWYIGLDSIPLVDEK